MLLDEYTYRLNEKNNTTLLEQFQIQISKSWKGNCPWHLNHW
jgi:hypothetical protein